MTPRRLATRRGDQRQRGVVQEEDGSIIVPGSFPVHDLDDLDVEAPAGEYSTVGGLILDQLGYVPRGAGARITVGGREFEVLEVVGRAISQVCIHPRAPGKGKSNSN